MVNPKVSFAGVALDISWKLWLLIALIVTVVLALVAGVNVRVTNWDWEKNKWRFWPAKEKKEEVVIPDEVRRRPRFRAEVHEIKIETIGLEK